MLNKNIFNFWIQIVIWIQKLFRCYLRVCRDRTSKVCCWKKRSSIWLNAWNIFDIRHIICVRKNKSTLLWLELFLICKCTCRVPRCDLYTCPGVAVKKQRAIAFIIRSSAAKPSAPHAAKRRQTNLMPHTARRQLIYASTVDSISYKYTRCSHPRRSGNRHGDF